MVTVKKRNIFIVICIFFFICCFAYNYYKKSELGIKTEAARCSLEEDIIKTTGFAVRDEAVLPDFQGGGYIVYKLANGEKVSKGGVIAQIYNNSHDALLDCELDKISGEVRMLDGLCRIDALNLKSPDVLDSGINEEISKLRINAAQNDYPGMFDRKNELVKIMSEKRMSMGKNEDISGRIESLKGREKELKESFSGEKKCIYSPSAGCFVNFLDGYESCVDYNDVKNSAIGDTKVENIGGQTPRDCIGKLINSGDWYILCRVCNEDAERIKKGGDCKISFVSEGAEDIACTVHDVKDTGESEKNVIFCCNNMNEEILNFRKGPIVIKNNEYYGYKIKKGAVCYKDGIMGVNIKCGNVISFRRINVLYSNNEYVVASEKANDETDIPYLKAGDNIVTEGKDLFDGKFIK